jgi:hypothetical protein
LLELGIKSGNFISKNWLSRVIFSQKNPFALVEILFLMSKNATSSPRFFIKKPLQRTHLSNLG